MFFFPFFSYAGEEKSLEDLVAGNNLTNQSVINKSELDTNSLINKKNIHLQHKAGDEGEYEIRVDSLDPNNFKDQASRDSENNSCKKSKKEKLVCANMMCDFGILYGEWSHECQDIKVDFLVAKATLPPWKSLPTCLMVDKNCNGRGKARKAEVDENFCHNMPTLSERHQCLMAKDMSHKKGANQYIEENGGDISTTDGIEFIKSDPVEIGSNFLVNNVDNRFNYKYELTKNYRNSRKKCKFGKYKCKWVSYDTGIQPMAELDFYLKNRDNPAYQSIAKEKWNLLVTRGTVRSSCVNVPYNEFYNCNYFPDLPRRCWSSKTNKAITECLKN